MIKTGVYSFYSKHKTNISEIFNFDQLALMQLSILESRNWFKRLYLFCDNIAAKVLIDNLDLPFESVGLDLEDFIPHPYSSFWAMAKVKTYSLVYEPFCHIDNDVVLYNGLPQHLLNAELIAQSKYEIDFNKYRIINYIPMEIWKNLNQNFAYNAGIIGGNNWEFFQKFWELSYETLKHFDNRPYFMFTKNAGQTYNVFLEEIFYAILGKNRITPLFKNEPNEEEAIELGYTHLAAQLKHNPYWKKRVRAKLLTRHPNEYYKLQKVCRDLNIPTETLI